MHIKSKLFSILGDLLFLPAGKLSRVQLIQNHILNPKNIPEELNAGGQYGGFIRILATDDQNAKMIKEQITNHRNEIPYISVHIADKAFKHAKKFGQQEYFNRTVIVKMEPKALLESSWDVVHKEGHLTNLMINDDEEPQKVVIDFSSPNIAKPFHYGHLKSTIVGNCIANLYETLGNQVVRLNYLGDWGTQYGLLSAGIEKFGNKSDISSLSLGDLVNIYVKANELGQSDNSFFARARRLSKRLETSDDDWHVELWRRIRRMSVDELEKSYNTLGVRFDVFDCESKYAQSAKDIVEKSSDEEAPIFEHKNGMIMVRVPKGASELQVPFLRSDGSSLYISRDVCAAIDRNERYKFDKMLYVAGIDQEKHFSCLREIIKKLGHDWYHSLQHVKIGKVLGMSSRSGNFVLLSQIIDEVTERFIETTMQTATTKTGDSEEIKRVGKILALSNLFLYDMIHGRTQHYEFSWDQVMDCGKSSGVNLQLAYARLFSLIRRASEAGIEPYDSFEELNLNSISSLEAMNLMSILDDLDNAIRASYDILNPSLLVHYALGLCNIVNRARQSENLWVLGERKENYARTRLTLFKMALHHLEKIIRLFGLEPLEKV